ncbi:MAG: hypothetical protein HGA65_12495 [Oscillochloris sp.]|nr:hypothetical protein [Oscillochloris sp.]
MMRSPASITVTLHWQGTSGPRSANIICEDSPPGELIPILATGCGLPAQDAQGAAIVYGLRLGVIGGPILRDQTRLSAQGVADGSHLWLSPPRAAAESRHCAIALGEGGAIVLPSAGLALTRSWLLHALALLQPEAHERELRLLAAGRSDYRYVSKQPHCMLGPAEPGGWQVLSERDDVATLLNGTALTAGQPARLADGDTLRVGEGGPTLVVALI